MVYHVIPRAPATAKGSEMIAASNDSFGDSWAIALRVGLVLAVLCGHPQAISLVHAAVAETPARNILLIIADDLGVDASSFYPASPRLQTTPPAPPTPNLTALARQGVLFRNFWATPSCSPTRATIFTGRYGFRTGVGKPNRRAGIDRAFPRFRSTNLVYREHSPTPTAAART